MGHYLELRLLLLLSWWHVIAGLLALRKKHTKKMLLVLLYFNKPTATEHEYTILRPTVELPLLMDHEKFIEISPWQEKVGTVTTTPPPTPVQDYL